MCGIFGAQDKEQFIKLYHINKIRGAFSFGAYLPDTATKIRIQGELEDVGKISDSNSLFLGHTRAPTGAERDFDIMRTPPFEWQDWIVGHNGIIKNFEALKAKYVVPYMPHLSFSVDSEIIPYLLSYFQHREGSSPAPLECAIQRTTEVLDGIYACWAYNTQNKTLLLFRCASPIYLNKTTLSFSSNPFEGADELEEGKIYRLEHGKVYSNYGFEVASPFYIPG